MLFLAVNGHVCSIYGGGNRWIWERWGTGGGDRQEGSQTGGISMQLKEALSK